MRIDGLQVQEGSTITNPVLPSGGTFPTSPDIGELFYLSSGNIGLHVYDGTGWAKVVGDASFQAAINNLLSKSGGTLTGPLVLPGNPTQNLEAATKQYVDGLASGVIPNTVLPGAGLTKTSETLDVVGSAGRIVVNADNIDLAATGVFAGEYTRMTVDVYGRVTGGTIPTTLAGYGIVDATPISHVGTGGASHAAATQLADGFMSSIDKTKLDGLSSNAATATKLETARTISLGGDVTGAANFDGSANITINATVADDSHNHTNYADKGIANTFTADQTFNAQITFNSLYAEQVNVLGSISGAVTINNQSGTYVTATLAGATTFTFGGAVATGDACGFVLELTNGGSAAVTWPTSIKWASGIAPSLTAVGVDILGFSTRDAGTTWHGVVVSKDSK